MQIINEKELYEDTVDLKDELEKEYFYQFKKDGKWWDKPHKLTEKEAKEEFGSVNSEYRKHIFANREEQYEPLNKRIEDE